MFLKVFKYDFKAIFFKFLPAFVILPVLAIVIRIIGLINLESNVFASIIWGAFNGFMILGCVLFFVYTLVICIMRYTKVLFRDQGYLTHTLPVTKHQLLLSQLLADVLIVLISVVFEIICCMIAYYDSLVTEAIIALINEFFSVVIPASEFFNLFGGSITLLIFCIIFSSLQWLFIVYTGIAIGHAFPKNKGILSVVFCIAINYAIGIVANIINLIVGAVGNFALIELEDMILMANIYLAISLVESVVICVVAYFLDIYLMKHKLNLE